MSRRIWAFVYSRAYPRLYYYIRIYPKLNRRRIYIAAIYTIKVFNEIKKASAKTEAFYFKYNYILRDPLLSSAESAEAKRKSSDYCRYCRGLGNCRIPILGEVRYYE